MKRTQKNKATEGHLGFLKAKLAKFRTEVRMDTVWMALHYCSPMYVLYCMGADA